MQKSVPATGRQEVSIKYLILNDIICTQQECGGMSHRARPVFSTISAGADRSGFGLP